MTEYEYGIEWVKPRMRVDTPHRTGMTLAEAEAFLAPDGDYNWRDVFKVVRRPVGAWVDLEVKVELDPSKFKLDDHKPGCRCMRTSPPFVPNIDTNIIGKDCGPRDYDDSPEWTI